MREHRDVQKRLKERCRDFIKEEKSLFDFLVFDDIFSSIMANRFLDLSAYSPMPDEEMLEESYYTALNYYFDRPDVSEEAIEFIKENEDYQRIVSYRDDLTSSYHTDCRHAIQKDGFTQEQLQMLSLGIAAGVDIAVYENPLLSPLQMYEALSGLAAGISRESVREYAQPKYPAYTMNLIRKGHMCHMNIKPLLDYRLSQTQAYDLYTGLLQEHIHSSLRVQFPETI